MRLVDLLGRSDEGEERREARTAGEPDLPGLVPVQGEERLRVVGPGDDARCDGQEHEEELQRRVARRYARYLHRALYCGPWIAMSHRMVIILIHNSRQPASLQ